MARFTGPTRHFTAEGKETPAMTRQAQVGAFTLVALLFLFGVFYVITDFGTRHTGYRVGVHFESAAGLTSGALVYFSGVNVGSVDSITLLPEGEEIRYKGQWKLLGCTDGAEGQS